MSRIRILAVDIDGCLTPGEGKSADIGVLSRIQELNARSETDENIPAVTLCTGRQQPFVDLMCQMIGCRQPAIFENGAGLYIPDTYDFLFHPDITLNMRDNLQGFKRMIEKEMVAGGEAKLQPGKEISLSVYPGPGFSVKDNEERLKELLKKAGLHLFLDVSILCINILFPGIDKGAGVKWLSEYKGMDISEIGAVGDAPGDIPALQASGFGACPANAVDEVKNIADFVAPAENGRGVLAIIDEVIRRNSAL